VPGLPEKPEAQKDYKYMGYRTIEEFVAERYHTSEAYIYKINPGVKFSKLKAGDKVIVPNVTSPFVIETVPYSQAYAKDDALSARKVLLDTKKRIARFFDQKGILMASFPITPGKDKFIKPGEFSLVNMVTTPEFRWDKAMLEKGERSEEYFQLPPGPNSPVGIFWASTSRKGIGLHGTSTPHTIGRSQSAGCIRFANWDAVRLPSLIRPGTKLVMQ
jgi:lipoprotein-anchoring transpeptidase ErfK/SrfK